MNNNAWWCCPKCGSKVDFNEVMTELFDDDGEAWFESRVGVPFYILMCENEGCNARWNIQISPMYED